jgi:signal peptidase I
MRGNAGWMEIFSRDGSGDAILPMLSGSMAPELMPGDALTVRPASAAKVHRGDIVVFRDGARLVAHRLVFAARLGRLCLLVEKGDANLSASFMKPEAIVGIVVSASRGGKPVIVDIRESRERGRHASVRSLALLGSLRAMREIKRRLRRREP